MPSAGVVRCDANGNATYFSRKNQTTMLPDRRDFLKLVGAGTGGAMLKPAPASAMSSPVAAPPEPTTPNIVLCMADDQGWRDMGYNGHPDLVTPHFDTMASEALRFDRFYAAAPVCSPTRGSVMTGRHPNRFGCFQWGHLLHPREIALPEALATAGYVTGHFGKWHLGPVRSGTPTNPGSCGFDTWFSAPNFFDNDPILSREGTAVQTRGESSMVTVEAALDFIRQHANAPRPFLAVVWFGSPHGPHRALDRDRTLYADHPEPLQHFYGEITAMDRAFGKLRRELRALGIHHDTLLWYCSDNGGLPDVGAPGGRGHKGQIYEGGLRVPAMLEWPQGTAERGATDVPCTTSDIYPTLLEAAGVRLETQRPLDGISLMPLLEGSMDARPEPIGFWDYPAEGTPIAASELMAQLLEAQQQGNELGDLDALRLEDWKIEEEYPQGPYPGHAAWLDWPWKLHRIQEEDEAPTFELYDLAEDPNEQNDLLSPSSDRFQSMSAALEAWQASVVQSLNGADYPGK